MGSSMTKMFTCILNRDNILHLVFSNMIGLGMVCFCLIDWILVLCLFCVLEFLGCMVYVPALTLIILRLPKKIQIFPWPHSLFPLEFKLPWSSDMSDHLISVVTVISLRLSWSFGYLLLALQYSQHRFNPISTLPFEISVILICMQWFTYNLQHL